jgi:hypothetical protein
MKMSLRLASICCLTLAASNLAASIATPASESQYAKKNQCAGALNDYLHYRRTHQFIDESRLTNLENRVETVCQGIRIKFEQQNGQLIGVIE